jgi:ribosomal-protein-alanine N-acetyltransferase
MRIETSRIVLRDFVEADRAAFLAYQMDPRYRHLYDLDEGYVEEASNLFSRFLSWQQDRPRQNYQLGIFQPRTARLQGCAGLRNSSSGENEAVLGIELTPEDWGRYRLAVETAEALTAFGFDNLKLDRVIGSTASGNRRVERLARWFHASIMAERPGADWMRARGWVEVDWVLSRERWETARRTDADSSADQPSRRVSSAR